MDDLLTDRHGERLPVADADLWWWPRIELGRDPQQLVGQLLDDCPWQQHKTTVYGKSYLQPRLSAWFGEQSYSYSGVHHPPLPWSKTMLDIRHRVEQVSGQEFNSVLLNYYRDQHDKMGMHSDDEKELGDRPVIASLSLGETRTLVLRHKTRKDLSTIKLALPCASLLLMRGDTQRHWRHGINAESKPCGARINMTFRQILNQPGR